MIGKCLICDKEILNEDKHIDKYHLSRPEEAESNKGGKGDYYCPLCNIRVKNKQRHFTGALHRSNVLKDAVYIHCGLKEYIIHFDKYCNEKTVKALEKKEDEIEDPFWSAAKQELSEEDYKRLKEYANGEEAEPKFRRNTNGNTRNLRRSRFSRTS